MCIFFTVLVIIYLLTFEDFLSFWLLVPLKHHILHVSCDFWNQRFKIYRSIPKTWNSGEEMLWHQLNIQSWLKILFTLSNKNKNKEYLIIDDKEPCNQGRQFYATEFSKYAGKFGKICVSNIQLNLHFMQSRKIIHFWSHIRNQHLILNKLNV